MQSAKRQRVLATTLDLLAEPPNLTKIIVGFASLVAHDPGLQKWLLDHGITPEALAGLPRLLHISACTADLMQYSPLELLDVKQTELQAQDIKAEFVELAAHNNGVQQWLSSRFCKDLRTFLSFLAGE